MNLDRRRVLLAGLTVTAVFPFILKDSLYLENSSSLSPQLMAEFRIILDKAMELNINQPALWIQKKIDAEGLDITLLKEHVAVEYSSGNIVEVQGLVISLTEMVILAAYAKQVLELESIPNPV
jgi:hypothetical protein